MVKNLFVALFALALSLAVYLYFYLGVYKPVEVTIDKRGPFYFLYKEHIGAYHFIGPTIAEVENWARLNKIPCEKTFGEYIDDPAAVDQDRLRSHGGCILSAPLAEVKPPYKLEARDENSYVVARFNGSPSIGPFKVYPRARDFIAEQRLKVATPVIETYLVHGRNVEMEVLFLIEAAPNSF